MTRRALVVLGALGLVTSLAGCPGSSGADAPNIEADGGVVAPAGPAGPPLLLGVQGERLAPLPPAGVARSDVFTTSDACAQCHLSGTGTALRDASGKDVSPVGT